MLGALLQNAATGGVAALDAIRLTLDPITNAGVALAIFLIMTGVALGLTLQDFRALIGRPRRFAVGVAAQTIALPLATFVLVLALSPPPSLALGMMVVAACPGGSVSNLFTYASKGDVAYSVALTAISSFIAALVTPASILFWSSLYAPTAALLARLDFNALAFMAQTTALLAAPLALGMTVRAQAPAFALRIRVWVARAGAFLLALVATVGAIQLASDLLPAIGLVLGIAILHNAVAFGVGWAASRLIDPSTPARRALLFEVGIQNTGLALVILLAQLKGVGGAFAIAAVWGIWHLAAGGTIVAATRAIDRRRSATGL